MSEHDVFDRYQHKPLAVQSHGDQKKIYAGDFSNRDKLLTRLYELNCHELTLTDDGLNFIKEYYTLHKVADMIRDEVKKGVDFKYSSQQEIIEWLEARGNYKS